MKKLFLSQNQYALVDDEDYERANKQRWSFNKKDNIVRGSVVVDMKSKGILLHRFIMNAPKNMQVDHINGNRLDNRKENLRLCTHQQNQMNKSKQVNNTSGYKGVSLNKGKSKYRARITLNRKEINLGSFKTKEKAALAYNQAAKKYHGKFANLNIL